MVPSIYPLETLHNSLSLKQVDEFLTTVCEDVGDTHSRTLKCICNVAKHPPPTHTHTHTHTHAHTHKQIIHFHYPLRQSTLVSGDLGVMPGILKELFLPGLI